MDELRYTALSALAWLIGSPLIPSDLRWRLYRLTGMDVDRCRVGPGMVVTARTIRIGSGTRINSELRLEGGDISIGRRVNVGPRVTLISANHLAGTSHRRAGALVYEPITIGDGAWIGAGAMVLPGVRIGAGAVVAAGAVVRAHVPAHTLVAGVPAVHKAALSVEDPPAPTVTPDLDPPA